ncbi:MAG: glycine--tRNA ligase [Micromonosporaceae bacterium]|nr:glycine--tRNA ligase [Micromonosporaceae bacterium]
MLTMQDALARLATYWSEQGCLTVQPMNTEVGAGTLNPATFLRVLGPEPWRVAYVEPSVRPDDSRYGENPNRIQCHTQFQVILKPEPGNAQELYLGSLTALGIDTRAHDVRFVEDNWASPALGAWGLGWEVWLDGLEITQFTYFQQAGGVNLDPTSVEITYGVERILMALQGVTHFKEIAYAPGVTYGEVFGQGEYEMSRYYLDDADVATNRQLLDLYAREAQRMTDAGLPVPAQSYVLKCSHAFNVLDARGAVSTAERASAFADMRRLSGDVARLWIARREELGHPLGIATKAQPSAAPTAQSGDTGAAVDPGADADTSSRQLLLEIGTEEMPPAEARAATEQARQETADRLGATRLRHGAVRVLSTPRRLVVFVDDVAAREDDHIRTVKGPKVAAAFGPDGTPTRAALGFARSQGVAVDDLARAEINGVEHLVVLREEPGRPAVRVLAEALGAVVRALRSGKNMRWGDPELAFTRPIRWLGALWGDEVVPVEVSTLVAGRTTRVHRTDDEPTRIAPTAEEYLMILHDAGIVVDPDRRREQIIAASGQLAATVDGRIDAEAETRLVDQIVDLVELPVPVLGAFDPSYLDLPEPVLTTVMRKHQRYLPVLDETGRLLPHFVAVANGPVDCDLVRAGNEAVLRARYEDAAFFYRADRQTPLSTMRQRLGRLTFTDKLGSMADRADRITSLANTLAARLDLTQDDQAVLDQAAPLVKFDLGSQLVTEMTSLAGIMAHDYAQHATGNAALAQALHETELPRQAGDRLPASLPGACLSVADRLDFITGLAATVGLPTGSSDPFALRRAVLGLLAVLRAHPALSAIGVAGGLAAAARQQPVPVEDAVLADLADFAARRLEQALTEEGHRLDHIRATMIHADRPHVVDQALRDLTDLAGNPDFHALAEALQRSHRIVPAGTEAGYDPNALVEDAEVRLHETLHRVRRQLPAEPDLPTFLAVAGEITAPVTDFFDQVFVMAEEPALRQARLGLLASVWDLGTGVCSWQDLRFDL